MASDTRARMIDGAARLLAQRGLQETSFSGVLELTGAPRGSIYHHFPEGKDQLVGAAVDRAGEVAIAAMAAMAGNPAEDVTAYFLKMWRSVLTRSEFQAGCSVLAVTVATASPTLLEHTASVFRNWRTSLAALLEEGGLSPERARRFAATLIAATEGAVVVSRAEQSLEPFDLVAEQLVEQVRWMREQAPDGSLRQITGLR